jgi:hypothetical protein
MWGFCEQAARLSASTVTTIIAQGLVVVMDLLPPYSTGHVGNQHMDAYAWGHMALGFCSGFFTANVTGV